MNILTPKEILSAYRNGKQLEYRQRIDDNDIKINWTEWKLLDDVPVGFLGYDYEYRLKQ